MNFLALFAPFAPYGGRIRHFGYRNQRICGEFGVHKPSSVAGCLVAFSVRADLIYAGDRYEC